MKRKLLLAPICALALLAAACGGNGDEGNDNDNGNGNGDENGSAAGEDWPDQLVLTFTPSGEQQKLVESAEPLAEALSAEIGIDVEAHVPTDYAGVIVALESGQAHVAAGLGPRQMVQAENQAGAEMILQAERFGSLLYVTQWYTNDPDTYCDDDPVDVPFTDDDGAEHTMLFCNGVGDATDPAEGPIGADVLDRVEGQRVAYVDRGSTSGFAVPALQLFNAGIDPENDVDASFAGAHDNAVLAVYHGDADVGLSYNDAREDVLDQAADVGEEVVVFGWSDPMPNDGFVLDGNLPEDLKTAITEGLLAVAATDEGAELLTEVYNIDALVEATSTDYDVIRDLEAELGDRLEE